MYTNLSRLDSIVVDFHRAALAASDEYHRRADAAADMKGSPRYDAEIARYAAARDARIDALRAPAKQKIADAAAEVKKELSERMTTIPAAEQVQLLQTLALAGKCNPDLLAAVAAKVKDCPAACDALAHIAEQSGFKFSGGTSATITAALKNFDKQVRNAQDFVSLLTDPAAYECCGARTPAVIAAKNVAMRGGASFFDLDDGPVADAINGRLAASLCPICTSLDKLKAALKGASADAYDAIIDAQTPELQAEWEKFADESNRTKLATNSIAHAVIDTPADMQRRERTITSAPLSREAQAAQSAAIIRAAQ